MRKSIKILVCILIAVIICLLNRPVYAKALEDYEVLDIINYCVSREGELPPEGLTIDLLEGWLIKIEEYDKQDLIENYFQVSTQAKSVINTWLKDLKILDGRATLREAVKFFKENATYDDKNELKCDLSKVDYEVLKNWLKALENVSAETIMNINVNDMKTRIQKEIDKRYKAAEDKSNFYQNDIVTPEKGLSANQIAKYFIQNNKGDNDSKPIVDLGNISNQLLVDWYEETKNFQGGLQGGISPKYINEKVAEELLKRGIDIINGNYDFRDIYTESDLEYWKPSNTGGNDKLKNFTSRILGLIQILGSTASVMALVIIGIKYMLGSVSEKAKYKEVMIPYIVGCVMLFGITNIAGVIYNFAINL